MRRKKSGASGVLFARSLPSLDTSIKDFQVVDRDFLVLRDSKVTDLYMASEKDETSVFCQDGDVWIESIFAGHKKKTTVKRKDRGKPVYYGFGGDQMKYLITGNALYIYLDGKYLLQRRLEKILVAEKSERGVYVFASETIHKDGDIYRLEFANGQLVEKIFIETIQGAQIKSMALQNGNPYFITSGSGEIFSANVASISGINVYKTQAKELVALPDEGGVYLSNTGALYYFHQDTEILLSGRAFSPRAGSSFGNKIVAWEERDHLGKSKIGLAQIYQGSHSIEKTSPPDMALGPICLTLASGKVVILWTSRVLNGCEIVCRVVCGNKTSEPKVLYHSSRPIEGISALRNDCGFVLAWVDAVRDWSSRVRLGFCIA